MSIILLIACLAICGIVETMGVRQKRSIGGTAIPIGKAPFYVSLRRDGNHVCGGALITTEHVLTAAHCIYDDDNKLYARTKVFGGSSRAGQGGFIRFMGRVARPRGRTNGTPLFNIGVIKVFRSLKIKKITLCMDPVAISWLLVASEPLLKPANVSQLSGKVPPVYKFNLPQLPIAEPMRNEIATLISFETILNDRTDVALKELEVTMSPTKGCAGCRSQKGTFCGGVENSASMSGADGGAPLVRNGQLVGITSRSTKALAYCRNFTNVYEHLYFINTAVAG